MVTVLAGTMGRRGLVGGLGVPFSAVGARVEYREGAWQGGGGWRSPRRHCTSEGRWCVVAFPVCEKWLMVGVEVLHHQEVVMKGEAPRMRAESGRRW
jgi:hypothetical protein